MSLDDFVNNGSSEFEASEDKYDGSEDNYKVIKADRQRKVVIPTEDVWNSVVKIVKEDMWLDIDEVLEMPDSHKFQILHQASLSAMGYDIQTSYPRKECIVCNEVFVFPHDWSFTRIRGETSCNDHSIREVLECVKQVNELEV